MEQKSATAKVHVYRDHSAWSQHSKWFMLPAHLLNELFVCTLTTTATGNDVDEYDAKAECVKQAELQYPNHVYVY